MSDAFNERLRMIRFRRKREKSKFTEELRIIPRWLILTCVVLYIIALIVGIAVNLANMETSREVFPPELRGEPFLASLALAGLITAISILLSATLFMFGYVYRDAKRRGMHPILWTIVVLILSPGYGILGLIIYLLVREPLPYPCPQCATNVSARFNFCPNCKTNLHPACPHCQREVSDTDKFCPYCGNDLVQPAAEQSVFPDA
jgi:RNA polymerase subunit RPABC4/transcription elongation factor Spt4